MSSSSSSSSLSSSVSYRDGIHVSQCAAAQYDELRTLFISVWRDANRLYTAAGVGDDELSAYADVLLARTRAQPWTCAVAVDRSARGDGRLVGFSFARDLHDDPVRTHAAWPRARRSAAMRAVAAINEHMVAQFVAAPAFAHLQRPGLVAYGLHVGTRDGWRDQACDGATVSQRVMRFGATTLVARGFVAMIGNAMHELTRERALANVRASPASLLVTAVRFADFEHEGRRPFASIAELDEAVCEVVFFRPFDFATDGGGGRAKL